MTNEAKDEAKMTNDKCITDLLIDWSEGNNEALNELFPLVEKELHRLAHLYMLKIRPGDFMQTTAVINETYLRLIDQKRVKWQNRAHFFGIAAQMMRRVLYNHIRDRKTQKRGGIQISFSEAMLVSNEKSAEILALEEALQKLSLVDERKVKVVELRYYAGLSLEETAEVLKISPMTVKRDWRFAKAWLARELGK